MPDFHLMKQLLADPLCIAIPTFCIAVPTRRIAVPTECIAVPTGMYRCTDMLKKEEMLLMRIVLRVKKTRKMYRYTDTLNGQRIIQREIMYRYTDTSHNARKMNHQIIGADEPARGNDLSVLQRLQRALHRAGEMVHPAMLVATVGA